MVEIMSDQAKHLDCLLSDRGSFVTLGYITRVFLL